MTKKIKDVPEDLRGFEEFIEGQQQDSFMGKPMGVAGNKNNTSFEHFTFLMTDSERLVRIKNLLTEKLPFAARFEQGTIMLQNQREEIKKVRLQMFELADQGSSSYRRALAEVFDSFFSPPQD
jgi:hypothetical protein